MVKERLFSASLCYTAVFYHWRRQIHFYPRGWASITLIVTVHMLHRILFLTYVSWYISQNELHSFKKLFDPIQDISFYTSCLELLTLK